MNTFITENEKQYQEELRKLQEEHLKKVNQNLESMFEPCAHDQCPECHGTGIKLNGQKCIHYIYCNCRKCNPYMN